MCFAPPAPRWFLLCAVVFFVYCSCICSDSRCVVCLCLLSLFSFVVCVLSLSGPVCFVVSWGCDSLRIF